MQFLCPPRPQAYLTLRDEECRHMVGTLLHALQFLFYLPCSGRPI